MKRIDANQINGRSEIMARKEILRLAESQRANLASKFDDLMGDGGPPDETADEMVRMIRKWRDVPPTRSLE